ncbi:MAG: DUF2147 domain-containing protein [Xanthobacteraceae bacterium]|nr:DUF2147 domain-containing protein [Xanthobacteraceae bacterium]
MRKIAYSGIFALAMIGGAHALDNPALGEWRVEDGVATIKIVDCNGRLWGVVASEKTPGGLDRMNPDASKRSRPTLGIPVLINMKKSADERDKWEGSIYNAKDGKTYDASIQVRSPTALVVEGCVLSILCGGQTWTRVPDTASPTGTKGTTAVTGSSPSAPKPHPQVSGTAPKPAAGQKAGAAPVSEVCLLPDIAGAPH